MEIEIHASSVFSLGLFGHAADEASEGREALRKLQLGPFDIVITDSEVKHWWSRDLQVHKIALSEHLCHRHEWLLISS